MLVDAAARAAELAARADVTVVVAGNHPLVNGPETEDRTGLDLPAAQEPAILRSAHGGQEYGRALADVLFGDADPAGRLTQTWYHSVADLPDLLDHDIIATDATYLYDRAVSPITRARPSMTPVAHRCTRSASA